MGQEKPKGNIVATYKFGNSTCHITDAALPKTEQENIDRWKAVLRSSARLWQNIMEKNPVVQAYHAAGTDEEREALIPALHAEGFSVRSRKEN